MAILTPQNQQPVICLCNTTKLILILAIQEAGCVWLLWMERLWDIVQVISSVDRGTLLTQTPFLRSVQSEDAEGLF